MYSPKIPERFIPLLYRLGRAKGRPMTELVAEAVERYLAGEGVLSEASCDGQPHETGRGSPGCLSERAPRPA